MNVRRIVLSLLLAAALVPAACQQTGPPSGDEPEVFMTVDGNAVLRTVSPGLIFGANLGAWVSDTKLGTTTQNLLEALRPSVARFPGGNISNNFCWVEQMVSDNDHLVWQDWSWGIDVGEFIAFIKSVDCVPMFSLNPFDHAIDGVPHSAANEAEDLARVFVDEGFAGAYYEVGNENDGSWNPMLTIEEYADRFVLLARAVKTIDPSAQFMGPVGSGTSSWIDGFLDRLALLGATGLLDWISFHRYGGWISNSNANGIGLDDPQQFGLDLAAIRASLDGRGLGRVKIAVTEINAAIWDTGCTRDQFTIKQGLWLADALGVSLLKADAVNVWIHLHPGADPHALIDSEASPPAATKNYWPVALPAQTLSSADPAAPVEVLAVARDVGDQVMTAYAVRKTDGALGVLLLNKSDRSYDVAVNLPAYPQAVTARRIGPQEYDAGTGPAAANVRIDARRARISVPAKSIVGLDVR
ncbi:MAG: hypothetical protein A2W20_06845 [Candidatus Aminicenantes bacterium RBG_16_66_30]|nr:MAG: hypothetical protein A2W20_06845 [Candidatus Aminicenantes bacterium RBG_16_66_30]